MTTEELTLQRKEDIDKIIEELKESSIVLDGDFKLQFEYIEGDNYKEHHKGFHMTIWPKGKDGNGITMRFDPCDIVNCSGVAEVINQHKRENHE